MPNITNKDDLLNDFIQKVNQLSKKYNALLTHIDSHIENNLLHYNAEKIVLNDNRLKDIESFINRLNGIPIEGLSTLSNKDIDILKQMIDNSTYILNITKYQDALFDYILERKPIEEVTAIIEDIKNDTTIQSNMCSMFNRPLTCEKSQECDYDDIVINARDIVQGDNYRMVSTTQIDRWDECVKTVRDIIDTIKYKEDTAFTIMDKVPLANNRTPGLMSSYDYNKLENITEDSLIKDWDIADKDDPKYIRNKPTCLPANGGNSDTVGGYTADYLINKDKLYITVGDNSNFDFNMLTSDLISIIEDATINTSDSEIVNIKLYPKTKFIVNNTGDNVINNINLDGLYSNIILVKDNIYFNNCKLKDINFATTIRGINIVLLNDCKISDCTFTNCNVSIYGSNNTVSDCTFKNLIDNETYAIDISTSKEVNCSYNIINNNRFMNNDIRLYGFDEKCNINYNIITNNILYGNSIIISGYNVNYNNIVYNSNVKGIESKSGFGNIIA